MMEDFHYFLNMPKITIYFVRIDLVAFAIFVFGGFFLGVFVIDQ